MQLESRRSKKKTLPKKKVHVHVHVHVHDPVTLTPPSNEPKERPGRDRKEGKQVKRIITLVFVLSLQEREMQRNFLCIHTIGERETKSLYLSIYLFIYLV